MAAGAGLIFPGAAGCGAERFGRSKRLFSAARSGQAPRLMTPLRRRALLLLLPCLAWLTPALHAAEVTRPNILFIAVDDLNHWVGHLGRNPQTKTPHLDRLAKMGVTFTRAYCAAPVCNPSRAALMSGRRPGGDGRV